MEYRSLLCILFNTLQIGCTRLNPRVVQQDSQPPPPQFHRCYPLGSVVSTWRSVGTASCLRRMTHHHPAGILQNLLVATAAIKSIVKGSKCARSQRQTHRLVVRILLANNGGQIIFRVVFSRRMVPPWFKAWLVSDLECSALSTPSRSPRTTKRQPKGPLL